MRIGHGYDLHRLEEERKLVLCGVTIPFEKGLLGHSDADVAVHALIDALLGAAALGDIGKHFPDTDEQYRDANSIELLKHVVGLLAEKGYWLGNADVTIIAQAPKLAPHILRMRKNLAEACGVELDRISVKAT
ncbi:MAG TPA: 2-C-methyl-D-erythritol 2,4-cyclodiphosphate synthase, partial [Clostridiales bacterium]|nr:2-C-methyl-D-erythritol 2,4-cyclodiphosphate synthase [Clostridiales bacterium]